MKILTLLNLPKIVPRNMMSPIPRKNRMIAKRLVFPRVTIQKVPIHNMTAQITRMMIHLLVMKMALGSTIPTMI